VDLGLADKAFIVTGGSSGLGLAGAAALAADGAHVVLAARDRERVHAAAATVGGLGVVADLADPEAAPRLVRAAHDAYGRVDGALISVGGPPPGATLDITDEQWVTSFDSVFLGVLRTVRAVVAALPPEGGSLALVLSTSVKAPIPGLAISNGLRPGLGMLVKSLADELGPRAIRINALLPGRFDTDRVRQLDAGDPALRASAEAAIPLRRYGLPPEFGRVAAFVLSPAASFVSGSMIAVDGGLTRAL
jgi:3-oxoacyl-[acyl-carrier protein] reductase